MSIHREQKGNNFKGPYIGKIPLVYILFPPLGLIMLYKYLYNKFSNKRE